MIFVNQEVQTAHRWINYSNLPSHTDRKHALSDIRNYPTKKRIYCHTHWADCIWVHLFKQQISKPKLLRSQSLGKDGSCIELTLASYEMQGLYFLRKYVLSRRLSHLGNTKANVLLGSWWLLLTLCTQLQHMSHLRYPDFLL